MIRLLTRPWLDIQYKLNVWTELCNKTQLPGQIAADDNKQLTESCDHGLVKQYTFPSKYWNLLFPLNIWYCTPVQFEYVTVKWLQIIYIIIHSSWWSLCQILFCQIVHASARSAKLPTCFTAFETLSTIRSFNLFLSRRLGIFCIIFYFIWVLTKCRNMTFITWFVCEEENIFSAAIIILMSLVGRDAW